jgi:hypothetical protein
MKVGGCLLLGCGVFPAPRAWCTGTPRTTRRGPPRSRSPSGWWCSPASYVLYTGRRLRKRRKTTISVRSSRAPAKSGSSPASAGRGHQRGVRLGSVLHPGAAVRRVRFARPALARLVIRNVGMAAALAGAKYPGFRSRIPSRNCGHDDPIASRLPRCRLSARRSSPGRMRGGSHDRI